MALSVGASAHAQELLEMPAPEASAPAIAAPLAIRPRLVGIILSTSQALLWDELGGEYVLKRVGEPLAGGRIVALDGRHLMIERAEGREQLTLSPAPLTRVAHARAQIPPAVLTAPELAVAPAVSRPVVPVAIPVAPVQAQSGADPSSNSAEGIQLQRSELDRELSDFASISGQVALSQTPRGLYQLIEVRPGSFVEKMGFRPGDVLLRVDGRPIHALEDASRAYAWVKLTDRFSVEVLRDGQPVEMHYVVEGPVASR